MFHLGIDYHKRYSLVVAEDDKGKIYYNNRVMNNKKAFKDVLDLLPDKISAVVEAGRTWGVMYDLLEELEVDVHLAHPLKVRAIAEAKIKTDSIDAKVLADLLRAGLIPEVYVPPKEIRLKKNILRQRLWLVRLQTMTKNRIHQILDRNHINIPFGLTDLFGAMGRRFLTSLKLTEPSEQRLLEAHLDLLDYLKTQIAKAESWIRQALSGNRYIEIVSSLPGFGEVLSAIVALEIEEIKRFTSSSKLVGYVGLIPSTYGSAGKVYHGDLIPHGNRWLRYAFVEGAWAALRTSPYCRAYYERIKRHKGPNTAIVALARKLLEIAYDCLKENRLYEERPYQPVFRKY